MMIVWKCLMLLSVASQLDQVLADPPETTEATAEPGPETAAESETTGEPGPESTAGSETTGEPGPVPHVTPDKMENCHDEIDVSYFLGMFMKTDHDDHGVVSMSKDGVYLISKKLFLVRKFAYDGTARMAQFITGSTIEPDDNGTTCLYNEETNIEYVLGKYDAEADIMVHMPETPMFEELKYFAVFERESKSNYGWLPLPTEGLEVPSAIDLGDFLEPSADHGTKGQVMAISSQVYELSNFTFDPKECKQCFFMVGHTEKPDDSGGEMLPDEGMDDPPKPISKAYTAQKIMIKIKQDQTFCMFKWFGIYDTEKKMALGYVLHKAGKLPPELGQNGKGWGPMTTTPSPAWLTSGEPTSSDEEETTMEETTAEEEEVTSERTLPPRTPPRHDDRPADQFAIRTESACGIILATSAIVLYFYH